MFTEVRGQPAVHGSLDNYFYMYFEGLNIHNIPKQCSLQEITKKQKTDCEIFLFTAYYLSVNYPELSKLSKKLFSKAVCLHWHVAQEDFNYSEIIQKYRSDLSALEQFNVLTKAILYSVKLRHSKLI